MVIDLGKVDYEYSYKLQREMVTRRRFGEIEDSVILAEHNSVFTFGRSGGKSDLRVDEGYLMQKGVKVLGVDRGGSITYHGPGQIVIYPIIKLTDGWRDLHKYMRSLEEVVIRFLGRYSVSSGREAGKTGVWVSGKKIASVGVSVSNWITYHGVSININPAMEYFDMIYPCGLRGIKMASLSGICGKDIPLQEAKDLIISDFESIFSCSTNICLSPSISHDKRSEHN